MQLLKEKMSILKEKMKNNKYFFSILIGVLILFGLILLVTLFSEKGKKIVQEIRNPYKPLYITRVEKINPKYYDNKAFFSCFDENMKKCGREHLHKEISYTGSFLAKINFLSEVEGNTTFDNCVGDKIDTCYNDTIIHSINTTPDPNTCIAYEDSALRQNCVKDAQLKLAILKDDISLCNVNNDPIFLQYCQDEFNTQKSVKGKDISFCDRLSQDYSRKICKDNFYFSVALNIKDISYCKEAGNNDAVQNCAQNFINGFILNSEVKNCNKIKDYTSYLSEENINDLYKRCTIEDITNKLGTLDIKKDHEKYMNLCKGLLDSELIKNCLQRVIDSNVGLPSTGGLLNQTETQSGISLKDNSGAVLTSQQE